MGWANRVTLLRALLTAALLVLLLAAAPAPSPTVWWIAFWLFAVTAATDALDGALARRLEEVSVFGRIADPLVDKLLVLGTSIAVLPLDGMTAVLPAWVVVVMLAREFLVTALRASIEARGVSFQAVGIGKLKMVAQCIALGGVLLYGAGAGIAHVQVPGLSALDDGGGTWNLAHVLVWVAAILTVISGLSYVRRATCLFGD
jgi:CDP-diacylglycerol--glycerol-3-phosphate 3-phosphatidyltransferase